MEPRETLSGQRVYEVLESEWTQIQDLLAQLPYSAGMRSGRVSSGLSLRDWLADYVEVTRAAAERNALRDAELSDLTRDLAAIRRVFWGGRPKR